jgi:predicted permease
MNSFFRKLSWLARRRSKEEELADEIRFHLDEETADHEDEGLSAEDARLAARRDLGNMSLAKEDTRAMWGWTFVEQLAQDLRYAARSMLNNRTFTLLAALSLALGIGANAAIYSFMDAILLRSLPVPDPQSLVMLRWHTRSGQMDGMGYHDDDYFTDTRNGFTGGSFPYPAFELMQRNNSVFSSIFAYQGTGNLNLVIGGQAELVQGEYVSGDYFHGLGLRPAAGRILSAADDRAGAPAVAVISFALSQRHFGGAANALGQSILINNILFDVVGVIPHEFFGLDPDLVPDFYLPMHTNLQLDAANRYSPPGPRYFDPNVDWVEIMARLRPGIGRAQAESVLAPLFHHWEVTVPSVRSPSDLPRLAVEQGGRGLSGLRRRYSKPLYVLISLVGLILAITCTNIANLLMARGTSRRREIAMRLSMGAGRLRIIRQLLTESVLLAALGGALGLAFAVWGMRVLNLLLANGTEDFRLHASLNWHVLALAGGLSLLTGVLFGLAPAIQSTRLDLMPALKESRTGVAGVRSFFGMGHVLIVSQIAITLIMLVSAGLFIRTLSNLDSIDIGFNQKNVLTFQLDAQQSGHRDREIVTFYNELRRQFSEIPGVRAASLSNLPLIGEGRLFTTIAVTGVKPKTDKIVTIGPGFFTTMQIPILLGREIDERDRPGAPMTAVVNEAFVKANFAGRNPLGEYLTLPHECEKCDIEIVGVSGNVRQGELKEDMSPMVYLPFAQGAFGPVGQMVYELRTNGNPLMYINAVREIVHRADARLPVGQVRTQSALLRQTINREVTLADLCSAFAFLALAIACVGLYGTLSYSTARRTSEIGIRMALGAQRGTVVWAVLREVSVMAVIGLAIGLPVALGLSKFVESFLFGMKPNDPQTLIVAVVILLAAALLAGYMPARKASRIDPMAALRHE